MYNERRKHANKLLPRKAHTLGKKAESVRDRKRECERVCVCVKKKVCMGERESKNDKTNFYLFMPMSYTPTIYTPII